MVQSLCLYVDDSGDRRPLDNTDAVPWFALGGLLIAEQDEDGLSENVASFRERWRPLIGDAPLHSYEIRKRKGPFAWMHTQPQEAMQFLGELTRLITDSSILCVACVIDRAGYMERYRGMYIPEERWPMCKTAFAILLERTAKYAHSRGYKLRVSVERTSKTVDRTMESYFQDLRQHGMPFSRQGMASYAPLDQPILQGTLYEFRTKDKTSNLMQMADLCLYPLCGKPYGMEVRSYEALRGSGRLIDSQLRPKEVATMGIKYSCFPPEPGNDNATRLSAAKSHAS